MTEHTPGPWGILSRGADDGTLFGWDLDGPPEPAMRGTFANYADATLAAAAPELLDALRVARDALNRHCAFCDDAKDQIYAAIKKAEGHDD